MGIVMRIRGVVVLDSRKGRSRAELAGQSQGTGPARLAAGDKGTNPFPHHLTGKKKGQGKTDLKSRNLHTVTEVDGA